MAVGVHGVWGLCAALIDVPGVALYPPHAAEEEQAAAAVYEVEQEDQEAAAEEPGTIF